MHLAKMPSGRWLATVRHEGRRRSISGSTRADAQHAGAELLLEMGATPRASNVTVAELVEGWFVASDLSNTYRVDARRVVDRLPPEFTARRLADVTPSVIEGLYRQLKREGWSVHRIGRAHAVLSSAWTLARRYEWAVVNPFSAAKRPVARRAPIDPPTQAQVAQLIAAADERFTLYLAVSSMFGARRGEVVALQWGDITDDAIIVRRSLNYAPGYGVSVTDGKIGEKGHRVLANDPQLASWLREHRVDQVELALRAGLPSPNWIFSHDAGVTPWRPDFATREFARLRTTCELPNTVKMKNLRHYVATQLLAAGSPLYVVGKRLGHRQLSTTSDTYGSFAPAADQAATAVMAGIRDANAVS